MLRPAVYHLSLASSLQFLPVSYLTVDNFQVVTSLADPSANIIFGAVVDDRYNGEIHVTIIATGFSQSFQKTLLTDPRAAKQVNKVAGDLENKSMPSPLMSSSSSSGLQSRASPRKFFF